MEDQLTTPAAGITPANLIQQSMYEITRETAVKWRRNWEADLADSQETNFVRSYTIDAAELEEILRISGMRQVRVYFGHASRGDHDRMILVAVDAEGKDMVHGEGAKFFDFTTPRPPFGGGEDTIWW